MDLNGPTTSRPSNRKQLCVRYLQRKKKKKKEKQITDKVVKKKKKTMKKKNQKTKTKKKKSECTIHCRRRHKHAQGQKPVCLKKQNAGS